MSIQFFTFFSRVLVFRATMVIVVLLDILVIASNNMLFNFTTRWIFRTNHKDITTLHLIFISVFGLQKLYFYCR